MDLLLANIIVITFYVSLLTIVNKKEILVAQETALKAILLVLYLLVLLVVTSFVFLFTIGWLLPPLYAKTFSYKAVFVTLILAVHWSARMYKIQIARDVLNK